MSRFKENFKSVNFGPKNSTFTPFWAYQELFSKTNKKKGSITFFVFRSLIACKKSEKSNEPIPRKRLYRQMDRAEFIGPSNS